VPIYLALLLLLKAMQSVVAFVKPFAMLLPEWIPAEHLLSLLLVLVICFLIGVAIRTPAGRVIRSESRSLSSKEFQDTPAFGV
jgi:hypothetical protein